MNSSSHAASRPGRSSGMVMVRSRWPQDAPQTSPHSSRLLSSCTQHAGDGADAERQEHGQIGDQQQPERAVDRHRGGEPGPHHAEREHEPRHRLREHQDVFQCAAPGQAAAVDHPGEQPGEHHADRRRQHAEQQTVDQGGADRVEGERLAEMVESEVARARGTRRRAAAPTCRRGWRSAAPPRAGHRARRPRTAPSAGRPTSISRGRNALPLNGDIAAARHQAAIEEQHHEHDREQRHAHRGRERDARRILRDELVHRRGDDVDSGWAGPSTRAAENEPSISANTKMPAPSTPGATSGRVTRSMVRSRPPPITWEASSSDGSIDFMTAPIMTKATEPSNRAMTQAMPIGPVMSMMASVPPSARQAWLMKPLSGAAEQAPGERAEQRGHVVGHRHGLLERAAERHVGAVEDPRGQEPEHERHERGCERDDERVEQDLRVVARDARNCRARRRSAAGRRGRRRRAPPAAGSTPGRARRRRRRARRRRRSRAVRRGRAGSGPRSRLQAEHAVPLLGEGGLAGEVVVHVLWATAA